MKRLPVFGFPAKYDFAGVLIPAASFFARDSREFVKMRALIAIAGTALALAACGKNDQTADTQNVGQNLSAADIVTNDVTAIDAVTGDAANMAADVNYAETDNLLGNAGDRKPATSRRPGTKRASGSARPAPDEPATNTASNTSE